jgi:hypothetical protein
MPKKVVVPDKDIARLLRHKRFLGIDCYDGPACDITLALRSNPEQFTVIEGGTIDDTVVLALQYLRKRGD